MASNPLVQDTKTYRDLKDFDYVVGADVDGKVLKQHLLCVWLSETGGRCKEYGKDDSALYFTLKEGKIVFKVVQDYWGDLKLKHPGYERLYGPYKREYKEKHTVEKPKEVILRGKVFPKVMKVGFYNNIREKVSKDRTEALQTAKEEGVKFKEGQEVYLTHPTASGEATLVEFLMYGDPRKLYAAVQKDDMMYIIPWTGLFFSDTSGSLGEKISIKSLREK